MRKDLGRDLFLSFMTEFVMLESAIKHDGRSLESWMKDHPVTIELAQAPATVFTRYEPLGVVGVFGAWNAPLATTMRPVIQAITAGNCVIVKPSEHSPHCSAAMKKLIDTYLDSDWVIVIEGGVDIAKELNQMPLDLICFTGSTQVGKMIAQTAAKNLTPCILEMGGKCPLIVDFNCDVEFATTKAAFGKTFNSGQICIAPDYVFVHETKVKQFIEQIQSKFKEMYGEKPEGCELQGKIINDIHTDRIENLIKTAGGTIICGGKVNKEVRHIEPTVIFEPDLNSQIMKEEIFGPVMPVLPFKDIRDVIKFINEREKPLAVYYFGKSNGLNAQVLASETSSGAFVTNELINYIASN